MRLSDMERRWYAAEMTSRVDAPSYDNLPDTEKARIADRVLMVVMGEVRRSEASPGDLAIWQGRTRDPEVLRCAGRYPLLDVNYAHVYDSYVLTGPNAIGRAGGCQYLFGIYNIGKPHLCNLWAPGQVVCDGDFAIELVSISAVCSNRSEVYADLREMMRHMTANVILGETWIINAVTGLPVINLHDHPMPQKNVVLRRRENLSVVLHFSAEAIAVQARIRERAKRLQEDARLVVHLEGVVSRPVR